MCETRFGQPSRGSNLEPVDNNQTTMAPTQLSDSYSGTNVNQPELSNKELPTSFQNFSVLNAAYQSLIILSLLVTHIPEPDVFYCNPAY